MASQLIRPNNSSGKTAWTAVPVGPNWSVVDEAITQPTAPTTGTDCVQAASGRTDTYDFTTYTMSGSEACTGATLWVYYKSGAASGITFSLTDGSNVLSNSPALTSTSFGWASRAYVGALTQMQIDNLSATFGAASSGTSEIDAVYIELTITGTPAAPGSSKLPLMHVG